MKTAKEDLTHEHKAIEHALNILERMSDRIENNGDIDYSDINVLFPFIDARLSPREQNDLYAKFENHKEQEIGKGRHEELHYLLKKQAKKYLNQ